MVNVATLVVVQERIVTSPEFTVVGFTESVQAGAGGVGGVGVTVIAAEQLTVPPGPVTVPVNDVVVAGETDCVPLVTGATFPMPLLMLNVVAFVVVHERIAALPV